MSRRPLLWIGIASVARGLVGSGLFTWSALRRPGTKNRT
ncbi:hypothetical protein HNR71_003103 [Kribbella sandramycini]|uniref:Uncharacterized protein n=1 Tax=Kribbella sandramycini TaxID=60450 RepID=A0A841SHA7_9ACTN|nr:hypothetical protein [Kribbella sandramycini]